MPSAAPPSASAVRHRSAPWWARAWVVTLALTCVAAGAIALSPALRHQVRESVTRAPQPFLELYFADEVLARACLKTEQGSAAQIAVRSHLQDPATLEWRAVLSGSKQHFSGTLDTVPGAVTTTVIRYKAPSMEYTLKVALVGRSEHLVLHCGGEGGA
jgi:hypothetical protein